MTFTDFTDEELKAVHNEYIKRWRANHPGKNAEYCKRYRAKKKAAEQADRLPDTDKKGADN